ncbi:hypothetical protein IPH25_04255 [bacterium]|nr:MAG: hypothetical protein IPG37_01250 [bacterium]QQR61660.1 MAG: hypothetical protein IPH25_04255 [bacterium]QQR62774.1 MAG: hypothetical protein IPH67_05200 [bacterium]
MYLKTVLSILAASVLYVLPFYRPNFYLLAFFFPLPLFWHAATVRPYYFAELFLFAFLSINGHMYGVFEGIFKMTEGDFLTKFSLTIVFLTIQSFFASCSFAFFANGFSFFQGRMHSSFFDPKTENVLKTAFGLFMFIFYLEDGCLFFLGRQEGYLLTNPLIPLAHSPSLLAMLPFCGKLILLALLLLTPALLIIVWMKSNLAQLGLLGCLLFFWTHCFFLTNQKAVEIPAYVEQIVALPKVFAPAYNLTFLMSSAADIMKAYTHVHPNTKLFIMPESSFYCEFLKKTELSMLWSEEYVGKKVHVLAGAFRWKGNDYYNSVHWIYNGVVQKCFDKRHTMVMTERLPRGLQKSRLFQNIFFSKQSQIAESQKPKTPLKFNETVSFIPYICSELFFNTRPDDAYPDYPIIAVCNDRLLAPYVSRLMFLGARFQAIAWQRPIVYVSFVYQTFIDQSGKTTPLAKVS